MENLFYWLADLHTQWGWSEKAAEMFDKIGDLIAGK